MPLQRDDEDLVHLLPRSYRTVSKGIFMTQRIAQQDERLLHRVKAKKETLGM